jgi:DNA-directed RNA polymerase specialized sigma24 family protein
MSAERDSAMRGLRDLEIARRDLQRRVKRLREQETTTVLGARAAGLSGPEIADAIGVTHQYVYRLIRNAPPRGKEVCNP